MWCSCLQNSVTEEEQRFGSKTVEGSGSGKVVKLDELRAAVQEDNAKANAGESTRPSSVIHIIIYSLTLLPTSLPSRGKTPACASGVQMSSFFFFFLVKGAEPINTC